MKKIKEKKETMKLAILLSIGIIAVLLGPFLFILGLELENQVLKVIGILVIVVEIWIYFSNK